MGIRIKQCIGYGLDITGLDKTRLKDWDYMEDESIGQMVHQSILEDIEMGGWGVGERAVMRNMRTAVPLCQQVIHEDEGGDPDKVLLIPQGYYKCWHRCDDDIDYMVHHLDLDPDDPDDPHHLEPVWRQSKFNIYPYSGRMKQSDLTRAGWTHDYHDYFLDNAIDPTNPFEAYRIPNEMFFVLEKLELGPDPQDLFTKLRPTFYRYWN